MALGGEFGGGGEVDAVAGVDGRSSEGDRQHGLAHSGRADEQHVGGVVEEAEGGQVADQLLVDAGLGSEVEVGQGPGLGQALLELERALDAAEKAGVRLCSLCGAAQELEPLLSGFDRGFDPFGDVCQFGEAENEGTARRRQRDQQPTCRWRTAGC